MTGSVGAGLAPARGPQADPCRRPDPRRRGSPAPEPVPPRSWPRTRARSSPAATRADHRRTPSPSRRPGSRSSGRTTPRMSRRARGPYRLAVSKALTAIDPDNPELAAARERRHPGRVVAAGHRGCGARPHADRDRRHPRQEHHGGLAGPRAGVRRRGSVRVRRGIASAVGHGRPAGHGSHRGRRAVRGRGG